MDIVERLLCPANQFLFDRDVDSAGWALLRSAAKEIVNVRAERDALRELLRNANDRDEALARAIDAKLEKE